MRKVLAVAISALTVLSAPVQVVASTPTAAPIAAPQQSRLINLPRGSSMAIDLPADARDVIIPNPQVAEAMLHSSRRLSIIGLTPGETDAVVLDGAGRTILSLRVRVDSGVSALQDTISRVMPNSAIRAEAVNDSIILTGTVYNPVEADRATQLARAFVTGPEKVINMMTVAGSDQVTLKVRVVEVQRTAIKQLGFDINALSQTIGDGFGVVQGTTFGVSGSLLGGATATYQSNAGDGSTLSLGLQAFERAGLVRTLAEPNLSSVNGENASFLAGGEFPVPTGRDRDGNTTIEYKPYGVSLSFRPIVLSEGRISLQMSIEVSELTSQGGFTLNPGTSAALTIQGLNVRRAQTTVELPSGGSLMVAGLLQESTRQNVDGLPGTVGLPIIGAPFRSRDYLFGETELVVLVEPYIVTPTSPARMQTPADGLRIASDAETVLMGQLNQAYGETTPNGSAPRWSGPVGYVIE